MQKTSAKYAAFAELFATAKAAGLAAGEGTTPTPITIYEATPTGEPAPGGKSWHESEGCCGFAWVTIYPGNCAFANYLKKFGLGSKAYGGGTQIWISEHGQSAERKECHANAMARTLQLAGLKAYAGSRLD